jgi:hypothetical protein
VIVKKRRRRRRNDWERRGIGQVLILLKSL